MRISTALCAVLVAVLAAGVCSAETAFRLTPGRIQIGTFYRGTVLEVRGTVPLECQVVLRVEGEREAVVFNRKGRRGPLWMTTGSVTFDGLPSLYLVAASCELSNMGSQAALDTCGLGYDALRKRVGIQQFPAGDKHVVFGELLRFEERRGTYAILPAGTVAIHPGRELAAFSVDFTIPAAVRPGSCRVSLYCFREGQMISEARQVLAIERVGFARIMADMAFQNGTLYGVLAVSVALGAGLAIGMLFGSRKGSEGLGAATVGTAEGS